MAAQRHLLDIPFDTYSRTLRAKQCLAARKERLATLALRLP
jgi:hypothetical protein